MSNIKTAIAALMAAFSISATAQNNIVDEVAWVIGDDPIYKSEIEEYYQEALQERMPIKGDPYCTLPEQMAIERLFLHQADLDTVLVSESMIQQQVEGQMNFLLNNLGSKEKIEQYFRKPYSEIRDYYATNIRNRYRVGQVKQSLTKDVKVTPNDVRRYFDKLPADSLPYVPLQVEVQIMTHNPVIPREEIESVKARLRDIAERVNNGESDFSTMAILYSEDDGSSVRGGEIGFKGRADLVAEYAAVAFNLNDPKKVSKIVETEYGYHIIQLIEKRGERVNTRHILLRPKVSDKDLNEAIQRLDSVRTDIVDNHKFSFEEGARYISQDKSTRYSNGVMVNEATGNTMFEMSQLPQEVSRAIATLQPGEISQPFVMRDASSNRDVVAIVKLTNRLDAHTANLADDFQLLKNMYENSAKEEIIDKWLQKKIRETYIRIEDGWRGCDFEHDGWLKNNK